MFPPSSTSASSSLFCSHSSALLRPLLASPRYLPPFNSSLLSSVLDEMKDQFSTLDRMIREENVDRPSKGDDDESVAPTHRPEFWIYFTSLYRNKRCVLNYLLHRIERILSLYWMGGATMASLRDSPYGEALDGSEMEFLKEYESLIGDLQMDSSIILNGDYHPPTELFVECRVPQQISEAAKEIINEGAIQTLSGPVHLQPHSTIYMKRQDAEGLIMQGVLVQTEK